MKTNKILFATTSFAILGVFTWFCVPGRCEPNSPRTKPTPRQTVVVTQPYVVYDNSQNNDIAKRQQANEQQTAAIRQDLTSFDTDIRTLIDKSSKQDAVDKQTLIK